MHGNRHKGDDNGRVIPINDKRRVKEHDAEEAEAGIAGEEMAAHEAATPAEEAGSLKAELEKVRAELKESQDKYLRLYADTENFKKRMNRDSIEREKYYNEGIIKDLLPVVDNLDRALAHAGEGDAGVAGIVEGVRLVKKQLMDVLVKSGVTEVESVGLPFDPARQQAVMQVETADYDDGVVVEELQKGYFLNDRILRPAMVTVSKRPVDRAEG